MAMATATTMSAPAAHPAAATLNPANSKANAKAHPRALSSDDASNVNATEQPNQNHGFVRFIDYNRFHRQGETFAAAHRAKIGAFTEHAFPRVKRAQTPCKSRQNSV
jgi:hypothetical protein